jgi:methionine sulfoxide reductase heme-binding subunit
MSWIWILIRTTGLTAYFLLTLSVLLGIFQSYPSMPIKKGTMNILHLKIGQIALFIAGVHAYLLLYDHYQPFTILDLLIPFHSDYHPFLVGIGILSIYTWIVIVFTSDFMKAFGIKVWKKIHLFVYPLWLMTTIHGFLLGSDSNTLWSSILYLTASLTIIISTVFLFINKTNKKIRKHA